MYYLHLIKTFLKTSTQSELAYRSNFLIRLLHAILNLGTGVLSLWVIFSQVEQLHGWELSSALALLGVYLTLNALRSLFIGPSLESVAGMDGEIWQGTFDFTLLRPADKQFLISFRYWRVFALLDLFLALGVLGTAVGMMGANLTLIRAFHFVMALLSGLILFYAILLAFASLVFWNSSFLFTWVFNDLFQLARYPIDLYPGWLQLVMTWIIPVGLMTTIPAQALDGALSPEMLAGSILISLAALTGASILFRRGLRKYVSASS